MANHFVRLGKIALVLAGIAYPFLIHGLIVGEQATLHSAALVVAPIALFGLWLMTRPGSRRLGAVVLAVALAVVAMAVSGIGRGVVLAAGVPHAIANLTLLGFFGRTLLGGREPLITRLARSVHGQLPPYIEQYTRRVTGAWCVFFALQVVLSALLYAFASVATWSLFINVLNGPLIILMFAGEYLWRVYRYRNFQHSTIMQAVRVFTRHGTTPASPNSQP